MDKTPQDPEEKKHRYEGKITKKRFNMPTKVQRQDLYEREKKLNTMRIELFLLTLQI